MARLLSKASTSKNNEIFHINNLDEIAVFDELDRNSRTNSYKVEILYQERFYNCTCWY
jgi:hypothetical protein